MTSRTAEVAVFAGLRGPARTFSYLVPDGLDLLFPGSVIPLHVDFASARVHRGQP